MHRALILTGDKSIGSKLYRLDLNAIKASNIEFTFQYKYSLPKHFKLLYDELEKLQQDKKLTLLSDFMFVYNISKFAFKNVSMRTRLFVVLFGTFKINSVTGVKYFLIHIKKLKNLLLFIPAFLGLIRLPEHIVLKVLMFRLNKYYSYFEKILYSNFDSIILFSSGYDNLTFILNSFKKDSKTQFFLIINNWDNPSSKCFFSSNFDKVALWNEQQINHILKYNNLSRGSLQVIGSTTADKAYSKYFQTTNRTKNKKRKLLYIGQQNTYDETADLLKIDDFIRRNSNSFYNTLIYRPHPIAKMKMKRFKLFSFQLSHIEVLTEPDIDLTEFDAIISLPTTMILEIVLSKIPAIIYTPRSKFYRRAPYQMWKFEHFNEFRANALIEVVENFDILQNFLTCGFPNQKELDLTKFQYMFPHFSQDYSSRLVNFISQNSSGKVFG